MLSPDGETMAINIVLDTDKVKSGFEAGLVAEIEGVIAPLQGQFDEVFQIGNPSITTLLNKKSARSRALSCLWHW